MTSKVKKGAPSKISDEGLEDDIMDEKGVIKRKSRNLSEKKRRDQFNILVNELCSMVCSGKRKMDKSTILKSAISFIRNHNQVTMQSHCQESSREDWKPSFLSNEEFTHLMLEALDEFIVVFSISGKILYVSENITSLLGQTPNNLIGSLITELVWEEESQMLESLLTSWKTDCENQKDPMRFEHHVSMSCHLRRGNTSNPEKRYELVNFSGYLRFQGGNADMPSVSHHSSNWGSDNSKGSGNYESALSQHSGLVFVGSARLQTPQLSAEMSIVDVSRSEFTSRHSLEWKFLFLDHRGPPIIGYLPFEVLGTSGYDYYHIDDLEKVAECHEALMQKGEVTSCCYRFLTKGQQWIWLQTKYYITYHQWYSKPEFIVCSHRVISFNEIAGKPMKTENSMDADDSRPSQTSSEDFVSSQRLKMDSKPLPVHAGKGFSKTLNKRMSQDDSNSLASSKKSHTASTDRSKGKSTVHHRRFYNPQSNSSASDAQHSESSAGGGRDSMLQSPQPSGSGHDNAQRSKSRNPSGSSRVGNAASDTNSMSSAGSFQSATSQHSRQSDQSMHSFHSQHSHQSMQSVQGHSQHQPASQTASRSSSQCSGHSCVSLSHQHHQMKHSSSGTTQHHYQTQHSSTAASSSFRNSTQSSRTLESDLSKIDDPSGLNSGHRFLQPSANLVSGSKRPFPGSVGSSTPTASASNISSGGGHAAQSFPQQVVSMVGVESSGGVTLPVQRIIEGLPVVTVPGIVAHEPLVLTPAQRNLHEQLRLKHMEIQKSILAQQEELRRVSEKLLLAQYGAWGPTVLQMTVPYSSEGTDGTTNSSQPTHAVLSTTGGLVTCLTTDTPISLGQISAAPQLQGMMNPTSTIGTMTFSPGTSIFVQSPELRTTLSPERDSGGNLTDSSQGMMRTSGLQQETLVQLSQQDIQMLLQHSNFLP